MHLFFKHMALRCWITVLTGIPIAFLLLSRISLSTFFLSAGGMYCVIIGVIFAAAGIGMDRLGRLLIKNAVTSAAKQEREGKLKKSEATLLNGVAIYNSGLTTPWRSDKTVRKLTGAMARFALTHDIKNPVFENAVTTFLKRAPAEIDIARQWLEKPSRVSPDDASTSRVLTLLARQHKDNAELLPLLAQRLMETQHNNFDARIIYCNCLEKRLLPPRMEKKIRETTHGNGNRRSPV